MLAASRRNCCPVLCCPNGWAYASYECDRGRDYVEIRKCSSLLRKRTLQGSAKLPVRRLESSNTGRTDTQRAPGSQKGVAQLACAAVLLGLAARPPNSKPVHCSSRTGGMWAGRLRQGGGSAFAALGPARATAAIKGKGRQVAKPKAKCQPKSGFGRQPEVRDDASQSQGGLPGQSYSKRVVPTEEVPPAPSAPNGEMLEEVGVASSGSSEWLPVQPNSASTGNGRADFPECKMMKRASKRRVFETMGSEEGCERMLSRFDKDMAAASSSTSGASLWRTWCEFHSSWFPESVPALPLSKEKIMRVGACFKEGGYQGYAGYAAKAKEKHILEGFEWTTALEVIMRKASLAVLRGVGTSRQSSPFDLSKALDALSTDQVSLPKGTPIGWPNLLVTDTFFVTREIELAFARENNELLITLQWQGPADDQTLALMWGGSGSDAFQRGASLPPVTTICRGCPRIAGDRNRNTCKSLAMARPLKMM